MAELLEAVISMASHRRINQNAHCNSSRSYLNCSVAHHLPVFISAPNSRARREAKSWKLVKPVYSSTSCSQTTVNDETLLSSPTKNEVLGVSGTRNCCSRISGKGRVFFLDVNPLCYKGSTPSLQSFARWISLFFSQVSLNDPVIAVSLVLCVCVFMCV